METNTQPDTPSCCQPCRTSRQGRIIIAVLLVALGIGAGYWSYLTYCPASAPTATAPATRRPPTAAAPKTPATATPAPSPTPAATPAPTGN